MNRIELDKTITRELADDAFDASLVDESGYEYLRKLEGVEVVFTAKLDEYGDGDVFDCVLSAKGGLRIEGTPIKMFVELFGGEEALLEEAREILAHDCKWDR